MRDDQSAHPSLDPNYRIRGIHQSAAGSNAVGTMDKVGATADTKVLIFQPIMSLRRVNNNDNCK